MDRKDNQPLLNPESDAYKSRYRLECEPRNAKLLFNCGVPGTFVRYGSLSVEFINSRIEKFKFHRNKQGFIRMYMRACLTGLNVNFDRTARLKALLDEKYPIVHTDMLAIIDRTHSLDFLPKVDINVITVRFKGV